MKFAAGAKVAITHGLFTGSWGFVVSHHYDGGKLLNIVEFTDIDDGVFKRVFFKDEELEVKNG